MGRRVETVVEGVTLTLPLPMRGTVGAFARLGAFARSRYAANFALCALAFTLDRATLASYTLTFSLDWATRHSN